jgi:hypothetical protein
MSYTNAVDAILKERLFGYGTPYRVEVGPDGVVRAVDTDAAREAEALSQLLANLPAQTAAGQTRGQPADGWAYSLPFGRCGVDALPREHIQVHFFCEAHLDVLSYDGVNTIALKEGQSICIEPGTVARLRARPYRGQRVLVAFQTQDHTPLEGNAGPFVADGVVADDWRERIRICHAAFSAVAAMDVAARKEVLDVFFARMAAALEGKAEIGTMQHAARAAGSYAVGDEDACFVRQRQLLSADVIERIRARDEVVFRFPGMFGAVAPLFNLLA